MVSVDHIGGGGPSVLQNRMLHIADKTGRKEITEIWADRILAGTHVPFWIVGTVGAWKRSLANSSGRSLFATSRLSPPGRAKGVNCSPQSPAACCKNSKRVCRRIPSRTMCECASLWCSILPGVGPAGCRKSCTRRCLVLLSRAVYGILVNHFGLHLSRATRGIPRSESPTSAPWSRYDLCTSAFHSQCTPVHAAMENRN